MTATAAFLTTALADGPKYLCALTLGAVARGLSLCDLACVSVALGIVEVIDEDGNVLWQQGDPHVV